MEVWRCWRGQKTTGAQFIATTSLSISFVLQAKPTASGLLRKTTKQEIILGGWFQLLLSIQKWIKSKESGLFWSIPRALPSLGAHWLLGYGASSASASSGVAKAELSLLLYFFLPKSALWDSLFCFSLLSPELCVWNDIYFSLWQHTVTAALTFSRADIPTGMTLMPLGRNQSRFAPCLCVATMPVAPLRAPSALVGKWSEYVGPRWTPGREQALSTAILLPISSLKCSCWCRFFPVFFFFFLFLPFFTCLWEGWFPVSPPVAVSLGSWAFVSWKKSAQASDQPLLVLRRI